MRGGADVTLLAMCPTPAQALLRGSGPEEAAALRREARVVEINESRREGGLCTVAVARAFEACLPSADTESTSGSTSKSPSKYAVPDSTRGTWSDALRVMQSALIDLGSLRRPHLSSTKPLDAQNEAMHIVHLLNTVGTRKAVCVGINYNRSDATSFESTESRVAHKHKYRLTKREDDVLYFLKTIEQFGFDDEEGLRVLVDDGHDTGQPTKRNIVRSIKWLTKNAQSGDSLLFYFSGRSEIVRDESIEETTPIKRTEKENHRSFDCDAPALLPMDFYENGVVTRDELYEQLVKPLPRGVTITVVFDTPDSSGCAALDLPFTFSTDDESGSKRTVGKTRAPEPLGDVTEAASAVADFFNAGEGREGNKKTTERDEYGDEKRLELRKQDSPENGCCVVS